MTPIQRTPAGQALSDLMLDLFRVTSLILTAGDRLVAGIGLTSARWQILGAIAGADRPQPVAWIARDMGANRQNVQRIVNDLHKDGLVVFATNPHHRRAQLVVLTDAGRRAFAQAMRQQAPWVDDLAGSLPLADIASLGRVLATLRRKLEAHPGRGEPN